MSDAAGQATLRQQLGELQDTNDAQTRTKENEKAEQQEEREAQQFKMRVQIEQIEALTKEKMENDELIKVQDRLVVEQESKIKELSISLTLTKEERDEYKESTEQDTSQKAKEVERLKKDIENMKQKLEASQRKIADMEVDRQQYNESEEQLKRQIKALSDNNLQNEKIQFKLKCDIDQGHKISEKYRREAGSLN